MDNKIRKFMIYRFLITTNDKKFHPDMIDNVKTLDELRARKNEFFRDALNALQENTSKHKIKFYKHPSGADTTQFLFRLQAQRKKKVEQDFKIKDITHQPSIWMAIDTDEDTQIIAVEQNRNFSAFTDTSINAFCRIMGKLLAERKLVLKITPLQNPATFWKFVKEHEGTIKEVRFSIHAPNMAALSKKMGEGMRDLMKTSGANSSDLNIKANKDSTLTLKKNNEALNNLVNCVDEGGGKYGFILQGSRTKTIPGRVQREINAPLKDAAEDELKNLGQERNSVLSMIRKLFRMKP